MLMASAHKFEQPAWLTQVVLGVVALYSTPAAIIVAFGLAFLFSLNDTPPLSFMIAFLSGTLLARGRFFIVLIPIFKLVIFDRLVEEHLQETSVMNMWNTLEMWIALTGFVCFYGGPLEFWFQVLVILFYSVAIIGRIVLTDISSELGETLPVTW